MKLNKNRSTKRFVETTDEAIQSSVWKWKMKCGELNGDTIYVEWILVNLLKLLKHPTLSVEKERKKKHQQTSDIWSIKELGLFLLRFFFIFCCNEMEKRVRRVAVFVEFARGRGDRRGLTGFYRVFDGSRHSADRWIDVGDPSSVDTGQNQEKPSKTQ